MANRVKERSFIGNIPVILAQKMMWESLRQFFWARWAKFDVPGTRITVSEKNQPRAISSPIVMHQELGKRQGDFLQVPMLRNLKGLPTIGKHQLSGHEEEQFINHARVAIDIVRHAVGPQDGIMMTQTTKDYDLINAARPQLSRHYAEVSELLGVSYALYYGYSYNVLSSTRFVGNSQHIAAYSHPNVFVAGQGRISGYPTGHAGDTYEVAIGTAISAMKDVDVFSCAFLRGLKADPAINMIKPLIMSDGNPMWLIAASPFQIASLEEDEEFKTVMAAAMAQSYAKDNPILTGSQYIYGSFAIFPAARAVFPVSVVSTVPVWGPSTIADMTSFNDYSAYDTFGAILLGENAIMKATGMPLEFRKREDDTDYGEIVGVAYRTVEGYSRADFWSEDDYLTSATRGANLINTGSAVLVTKAFKPGI